MKYVVRKIRNKIDTSYVSENWKQYNSDIKSGKNNKDIYKSVY